MSVVDGVVKFVGGGAGVGVNVGKRAGRRAGKGVGMDGAVGGVRMTAGCGVAREVLDDESQEVTARVRNLRDELRRARLYH